MPTNPKMNPTMLHHSTLDQLEKLRFYGMARALRDQLTQPISTACPFSIAWHSRWIVKPATEKTGP